MKPVDEKFRTYIEPKLREHLEMVPSHMHDAVLNYVLHRLEPGDFLFAVLTNDLKNAVAHADHLNKAAIVQWAEFCLWYLPSVCWGSRERVEHWLSPDEPVSDDDQGDK